MWQGNILINGTAIPAVANVTPAYNRDYINLTVSVTFNGFSYSRIYSIRGGNIPDSIIDEFKTGASDAYAGWAATVQFLISSGFTEI
jgi:hypothetical protein